jgi:hypothetical protein
MWPNWIWVALAKYVCDQIAFGQIPWQFDESTVPLALRHSFLYETNSVDLAKFELIKSKTDGGKCRDVHLAKSKENGRTIRHILK